MSRLWKDKTIIWKEPRSWASPLSRWLRPYLNDRGIRFLQKTEEQDLCWDDSDWLDIAQLILNEETEFIVEELAFALTFATARTYHGCRPMSIRGYYERGLLRNDSIVLKDEVRKIVIEEPGLSFFRKTIEKRIEECDFIERDTGRLYVVLDDRGLVSSAGHYLLYGSEWLVSLLGFGAHEILRERGYPTVILVDLPLDLAHLSDLEQLSRVLLQEWTRIKVNRPDWGPELDFTFCLREDISPSLIVGHYHPEQICDPIHQNIWRANKDRACPDCEQF